MWFSTHRDENQKLDIIIWINLLQTDAPAVAAWVPRNLPHTLFRVGSVVAPAGFSWKLVAMPCAEPPGIWRATFLYMMFLASREKFYWNLPSNDLNHSLSWLWPGQLHHLGWPCKTKFIFCMYKIWNVYQKIVSRIAYDRPNDPVMADV